MPVLGALTKYDSKPPLWFWDADGQRIELTSDELLDYPKFQRACLDRLNRVLPDLKASEWKQAVGKALETLHVEPVPEDVSPEGQFWELLERFCTGRTQARTKEEILLRKPWTDEGRTYFRLTDLLEYLERARFKGLTMQRITAVLRARSGQDHQFKISGKVVRAWSIPEFGNVGPFDVAPGIDAAGQF